MRAVIDTGSARRATFVGRGILAVLLALGAFLTVFALATSLPDKTAATGDMMTALRPSFSDQALSQAQTDAATMTAMAGDLQGKVFPALAQQMGMTPQQLTTFLGTQFPATGKGLSELGRILPAMQGQVALMQSQQANYQLADQIPMKDVSPTTVPWLFIIPGVLLMLLAVIGFVRPRLMRSALAGGAVIGVLMIVGMLSVNMYSKAQAADGMITAFRPAYTDQAMQQSRTDLQTVQAMGTELQQKVVPALMTSLHMTPAQFGTMLGQFPTVARGFTEMPQIMDRMGTLSATMAAQKGNFDKAAAIPYDGGSMTGLYWFMMLPAIAVTVAGALGLVFLGLRPRGLSVRGHLPAGGAHAR